MNLQTKLAVAFAAVGAVVAILVGVLSYATASDRIGDERDRTLLTTSAEISAGALEVLAPNPLIPDHGDDDHDENQPMVAQLIARNGTVTLVGGRRVRLPVGAQDLALAAFGKPGDQRYYDFAMKPDDYRVLTVTLDGGRGALQLGIDVDETRHVLHSLAARITVVSAIVLLGAALAGWLIARQITRRLVRLARLAEEVSASGRLDVEVPTGGRDEVGRLSGSFDAMLGRLAGARDDQERLVQDAAHELRTPLTSLRTNASVLRRYDELTATARTRLLDDVDGETRELTHLVDELVELATGRYDGEQAAPVDLAVIAERAAARIRRRSGRVVTVDTVPSLVLGKEKALERAMSNLLENAVKFDAGGTGPAEIFVRGGRVEVRDHGPGLRDDDAGRLFDRFYRADAARALPGSGLGLSIVREVALAHGGEVFAADRPGGGAVVGFTLGGGVLLPDSQPDHTLG